MVKSPLALGVPQLKSVYFVLMACLIAAQPLFADVLEFKNGDRLQGEVISMSDGVMKFRSAMAGEIEVPMVNLDNFSTDAPAALHFKDGTVLQQQVRGGTEGVAVAQGEVVAAQSIPVDQIAMINPPPEEPIEWTGRIGVGVIIQSGNTRTQDANIDIDAQRETDADRIIVDAEYIENKEENVETGIETTSKRRYALGGHYDYFLAEDWYVYGDVGAEKEVTANLDLRMAIGFGGGTRYIKTENTSVDLELGLSWVSENFTDTTEDSDYAALRVAWKFDRDLNDITKVFHRAEWFPSVEEGGDHLVKTETGIRTRLLDILSAEAKVIFDWDSTPAIDKREDDTTYVIGFGWDF